MKTRILNSLWIKIIAMISMTLDHIGAIILIYYATNSIGSTLGELYEPFRIIGRLSFVLIAFITIDGVIHSKKPLIYLSRLLILALLLSLIPSLFMQEYVENPITTIFFGAVTVYLLRLNKWKKIHALIPFTIAILCGIKIIPFGMDYGLYGYLLIIIFYFCYIGVIKYLEFICSYYSLDKETFMKEETINQYRVISSCVMLIGYNMLWYFLSPSVNGIQLIDMHLQLYSTIAIIPIFLYNGKRGYNKPWFKYGCYIFYPLHILIIYIIRLIIFC